MNHPNYQVLSQRGFGFFFFILRYFACFLVYFSNWHEVLSHVSGKNQS